MVLPWVSYLASLIPWDLWLAIGGGGATAVFLLVPNPFKAIAATGVVALCLWNAGASKGMSMGEELERAKWERAVAQERARLEREFGALIDRETERADRAEAATTTLKEQVQDANREASKDTSGAIVVPESLARSLYGIGTAGRRDDGTPPGARRGTRKIPGLFRPHSNRTAP